MTIPLAILLIVILLIYDAVFLKMLINRKKRVIFSIYVDNGEITSTEGDIPCYFLAITKELCHIYRPAKVKIMAIIIRKTMRNKNQSKASELIFSGDLEDDLSIKLNREYQNLYKSL